MCEVNGKMYLAGLVSWGIGCATEGKYALISYTLRFWYLILFQRGQNTIHSLQLYFEF